LIFIRIVNFWLMPIEGILASRKGLIIYFFFPPFFILFAHDDKRWGDRSHYVYPV
jgi:hypothetical protein